MEKLHSLERLQNSSTARQREISILDTISPIGFNGCRFLVRIFLKILSVVGGMVFGLWSSVFGQEQLVAVTDL